MRPQQRHLACTAKEIPPGEWHPLFAYVFQPDAASHVRTDAAQQLGERLGGYRVKEEQARHPLTEGTVITATPYLEGFQVNPPSAVVVLFEPWHRLDFKIRCVAPELDRAFNGRLTFTVEGIIVADVPLSVYVSQDVLPAPPIPLPEVKPYHAVFCSYSHQDVQIARRVEAFWRASGNDYLRDEVTLRSGQLWAEELLTMIDRSDLFQLFWSEQAARSEYVATEWRYALGLGRESTHFIRPVYWVKPMVDPPPELGHVHFAYAPDLAP